MTSFVLITTAVVSSKFAPNQTLPAALVALLAMKNPLTVPHTAVAVANVTCAAPEPRPDWVVPTVPQDALEMVWRTYAPALETSAQLAMTDPDPATVEAVQLVKSP